MELTKLSKPQLLTKCEELGINVTNKNKSKQYYIDLLQIKPIENIENNYEECKNIDISLLVLHNKTHTIKKDNLKIINQINQLFHNKGVKQDDRFKILMILLEKNNNNIIDEKFNDIILLLNALDYTNCELIQEIFMTIGSKYTKFNSCERRS